MKFRFFPLRPNQQTASATNGRVQNVPLEQTDYEVVEIAKPMLPLDHTIRQTLPGRCVDTQFSTQVRQNGSQN